MTVLKVLTTSPTDSFRIYLMFGGIWSGAIDYSSPSALVFSTPERNQLVINGTKFQYDYLQENPWLAGTITSIVLWNSDYTRKIAEIGGLNLELSEFGPKLDEPLYGEGGLVNFLFSGNDSLVGSAYDDTLYGHIGDDTLLGGSGDDYITAGEGADVIDGGAGFDVVSYSDFGAAGPAQGVFINLQFGDQMDPWKDIDRLISIEGVEGSIYADTVIGDDRNNVFYGLDGDDTLTGNGGDDFFVGGYGEDTFEGGAGHDVISYAGYAGAGFVVVDLAAGTATDNWGLEDTFSEIEGVRGTGNSDTFTGSDENDFFQGLGGDDVIDGGEGYDRVSYLADNNWGGFLGVDVNLETGVAVDGYGNTDTLLNIEDVDGTDYADLITGNADSNVLFGGQGNDVLNGLQGSDTVSGGDGNDRATGNGGDDEVYGGNGNDVVIGDDSTSSGDDWLSGGFGNDTLTGGRGWDGFIFDTKPHSKANVDRILDYSAATDTIYLARSVFTKIKAGWINKSAFVIGTKAKDKSDRIVYNSKNGDLFYDPDGTGKAAQVKFAVMAPKLKLTAYDFVVY